MTKILRTLPKPHTDNWYYSWIIALLVFHRPLRSVLIYFGDMYHEGWGRYLSIVSIAVTIVVLQLPRVVSALKVTIDVVIAFLIILLSWIISLLKSGDAALVSDFLSEGIGIFIKAFPFYVFSKQIYDFAEFKRIMYRAAVITVCVMSGMTILGIYKKNLFLPGFTYNQFYGMILAPACVVLLIVFWENRNILNAFLFLVSIVMMLYFGARSPIAVLLIAFMLLVFDGLYSGMIIRRFGSVVTKKRYISIVFSCLLIALGLIFMLFSSIINKIYSFGKGLRIITLLELGKFSGSHARLVIWKEALRYIFEHPFVGSGIINDRIILAQSSVIRQECGLTGFDDWKGVYAHNIFLELMMQYGMIVGAIICAFIVYNALFLLLDMDHDRRLISVSVISLVFGTLFFSGPVYNNAWFWVLLGLGTKSTIKMRVTNK